MLLQIGSVPRKLLHRQIADLAPHEGDLARKRRQDAAHRLEERALSRTVRSDEPDHLACFDTERDVLQDHLPLITRIESCDPYHFLQIHRSLARKARINPVARPVFTHSDGFIYPCFLYNIYNIHCRRRM